MRVAVSASGPARSDNVDPRFGRAACFVLVDTETNEWLAHDNAQNLNAAQGAGIQAAQTVAGLGAQAVVTGNVGPKAFRALGAAGIRVFLCDGGTVEGAVARLNAGELKPAASASVEGHWA